MGTNYNLLFSVAGLMHLQFHRSKSNIFACKCDKNRFISKCSIRSIVAPNRSTSASEPRRVSLSRQVAVPQAQQAGNRDGAREVVRQFGHKQKNGLHQNGGVPKINGRIKGRVKVVQELHQYEEIFI
jgi:hypothetical protein